MAQPLMQIPNALMALPMRVFSSFEPIVFFAILDWIMNWLLGMVAPGRGQTGAILRALLGGVVDVAKFQAFELSKTNLSGGLFG